MACFNCDDSTIEEEEALDISMSQITEEEVIRLVKEQETKKNIQKEIEETNEEKNAKVKALEEGLMAKRRKLTEEAEEVEKELRKVRESLNEDIFKRKQLAKEIMLRKLPENQAEQAYRNLVKMRIEAWKAANM